MLELDLLFKLFFTDIQKCKCSVCEPGVKFPENLLFFIGLIFLWLKN